MLSARSACASREVGRLIFTLVSEYFGEAAGRPLATGMVSSHRDSSRADLWRICDLAPRAKALAPSRWHSLVLEGGFDDHDRFYFIPIGASDALQELWRRRVIGFFLKRELLDESLAWVHAR